MPTYGYVFLESKFQLLITDKHAIKITCRSMYALFERHSELGFEIEYLMVGSSRCSRYF